MQDEFVTLKAAADMLGMSRVTLWRRIERDGIRVFQSQRDRRQRLIRREDVERLMQPVEVDPGRAESGKR